MSDFFETMSLGFDFIWGSIRQVGMFFKSMFQAVTYIIEVILLLPPYLKAVVMSVLSVLTTLKLIGRD